MSKIELKHIDKFYGKNHVLKDLNLTIEDGDFMTLLGPSGCGKTTTLRVVSGLEKPQNGFIYLSRHSLASRESEKVRSTKAHRGTITSCGARSIMGAASAIILPHVGSSGELPSPRKLSTDSVTMQRGKTMPSWVISAPMMFGSRCSFRMCMRLPPKLLAASTYSRDASR